MATNKLTFINGSTPVAGAEVLIGSVLGQALTTGIRGAVNFDLAADYKAYVHVLVTLADGSTAVTLLRLVYGENQTIDLGELATP